MGAVAAASGARVKVTHGSRTVSSSLPGFTTRTVTVTSANGEHSRTYTVGFQRTDHDHRPPWSGGPWNQGGGGGHDDTGLWSPSREWEDARGRW